MIKRVYLIQLKEIGKMVNISITNKQIRPIIWIGAVALAARGMGVDYWDKVFYITLGIQLLIEVLFKIYNWDDGEEKEPFDGVEFTFDVALGLSIALLFILLVATFQNMLICSSRV